MKSNKKYKGIFPAFYACYDDSGEVSPKRVRALTKHFIGKGVHGLYVGGSSGECIYQSVDERKLVLENVMCEARGRIVVIAHVACNNTRDSQVLAAHAQENGVDAIAAIPPIYYRLPEYSITKYWNDISEAAPGLDFIIYNIPQLAGVALNLQLLREMLHNPCIIGVKNSSMSVLDIAEFKVVCDSLVVFNGHDEQFIYGLAAGADGGIGSTYGVMPELYIKAYELFTSSRVESARKLQSTICEIIALMTGCYGSLYAVLKQILRIKNLEIGGARAPFVQVASSDLPQIKRCIDMIEKTISDFY